MLQKKSLIFKIAFWVVITSQALTASYCSVPNPANQGIRKMTETEEKFFNAADKLLDEENFDDVVELSDQYIKKHPGNSMYHQFRGLALVLDYADTKIPVILRSNAKIQEAVKEFGTSLKLQPLNEDKVKAAIALAYIVSDQPLKARDNFEPAIKKFPKSIHLNYVGINYYKMSKTKNTALASACESFVSNNNPMYNGRPVFVGITITIWSMIKILTLAIATGYIAGFKDGWRMRLQWEKY